MLDDFYFVYVLKSFKDGKFYTGYTNNIERRFEEHQSGRVASTKDRRPLQIIYYEASLNQQDATHREKYLKTYHGKMFLRNRLKNYLQSTDLTG
jgi:putative endonuclease